MTTRSFERVSVLIEDGSLSRWAFVGVELEDEEWVEEFGWGGAAGGAWCGELDGVHQIICKLTMSALWLVMWS